MKKDNYQNLPVSPLAEELVKAHRGKEMHCVIFGNFGAMNLGDEAILAGQLQELKKIPNLHVTVVARFPQEVTKMHNVAAISFYALGKIIHAIKQADVVIVGGGGIICKMERGIISFFYQLYMLSLFFVLPRLFKKKLYAWGIGVYDNTHPIILWLSCSLLRLVTTITVRDYHSYALLKSKNIDAQLHKDNSFLMELEAKDIVMQEDFFKEIYDPKRKHIGISLLKPSSKKAEQHLLAELITFMTNNYKTSDFWFYSCDYHPSYLNDEQFGQKLKKILINTVDKDIRFYFIPTQWHPQKFFSSFQLMDFMIAMRLHADIFAYRTGLNFLGISYDEKCKSFLASIGKDALEIQDISWHAIQKSFKLV